MWSSFYNFSIASYKKKNNNSHNNNNQFQTIFIIRVAFSFSINSSKARYTYYNIATMYIYICNPFLSYDYIVNFDISSGTRNEKKTHKI